MVTSFYQSSAFQNLAPSSQTRYRSVLDKFSMEDGHRLVRDMPRRVAIRMMAMANLSCKIMRRLFAYAINKELRTDNPFGGIDPYKLGSHRASTEAEIATYESTWAIGTRERLAFDLLLYTRSGDVAAMRRSDLRESVIHVTQQKTSTHCDHASSSSVAVTQGLPRKGLSLFGAPSGKPVSGKGLSQLIRRSARTAGLPKDCVAHGLRKSSMTRLADHGASTKEIKAVSGHRTLKEVEHYTEAVDNERQARAAIVRLPGEQNGT